LCHVTGFTVLPKLRRMAKPSGFEPHRPILDAQTFYRRVFDRLWMTEPGEKLQFPPVGRLAAMGSKAIDSARSFPY